MSELHVPIPFEAYTGEEPFLFVSYSHKDKALVFPILSAWHEQGYRVWYDEGIDPGNEWPEEIANALNRCRQFVVFITPNAVESRNVKNEINYALNKAKPFLAIHLVETRVPDGLELRMGDIQAILSWRMGEEAFQRAMQKGLLPELLGTPTQAVAAIGKKKPDDTNHSLLSLIARTPPGGTLQLQAGVYCLDEACTVDKPLTLLGLGIDKTVIRGIQPPHILRFEGPGTLDVRDISFEYAGTEPADCLIATAGEVQLLRCSFTGGVLKEDEDSGCSLLGAGVVLAGEVRGRIRGCQSFKNGSDGLVCQDSARFTVENSTFSENDGDGIWIRDFAQGDVKGCHCKSSGFKGIQVTDKASPTLENNVCEENQEAGISYYGSSQGTAVANTCSKNLKHGIYVGEAASPSLENNECKENRQCGMAFFGTSRGTAVGNTCCKNLKEGIYVGEAASPMLENNECVENQGTGISFFGTSQGHAVGNTCSKNMCGGIDVSFAASPTLENNECKENHWYGIYFLGTSHGTAVGNTCSKNMFGGIYVFGAASVTLENNVCEENQGAGIAYYGTSHGTAVGNTSRKNLKEGIFVGETASPTLENNVCEENGLK